MAIAGVGIRQNRESHARADSRLRSASGKAQAHRTSSTSPGTPVRSSSERIAWAPRASGRTPASAPFLPASFRQFLSSFLTTRRGQTLPKWRCSFIAPPLHEQVENLAFVVNRTPEPELPARNRHCHLIEMTSRCWPRASAAKFSGEQRSELQERSPHRLV
jgi:hypothetical protein